MINDKDSRNTFYVLDKKNDIPIVFIHGVGLDHKIWESQINVFENTFLAYDILGHGKTPLNLKNHRNLYFLYIKEFFRVPIYHKQEKYFQIH